MCAFAIVENIKSVHDTKNGKIILDVHNSVIWRNSVRFRVWLLRVGGGARSVSESRNSRRSGGHGAAGGLDGDVLLEGRPAHGALVDEYQARLAHTQVPISQSKKGES